MSEKQATELSAEEADLIGRSNKKLKRIDKEC